MPHLTIREYRDADWSAVCRIHDLARPIELGGFVPNAAVLPMAQAASIDGFFDSQTWVACIDHFDGSISGFVSIQSSEITWCYVDPALHRKGIGRKLVEHVIPKVGTDGFVLCVGENPQSLAFYRSLGFVIAARFPSVIKGTFLFLALGPQRDI